VEKTKFHYGYVIAISSALILAVGLGTYYCYSIFFNVLLIEFGWSRAVISGAFSSGVLLTGILGIIVGRITDRTGPKVVVVVCSVLMGLGFILMSFVHELWQIYLIYGVLLAAGISGSWPIVVPTLSRWFEEKRGLITGIVTSGAGLGSIIFSPLISNLISIYGWRITYVITGIIVLVVMISCGLFLKNKPNQSSIPKTDKKISGRLSFSEGGGFTLSQAVRTRQFWIIAIIYFLFGYSQLSATIHIVPYATGLGISQISASSVLAVIGAASIIGRITTGVACDKFHTRKIFIVILFLFLISMICLKFSQNLGMLYLFGLLLGLSYGGSSALQSLVAIDYFGLLSLGALLGSFGFSCLIGGSIGPVLTGFLFDVSGTYDTAFVMLIVSSALALTLIFWLSPIKRKRAALSAIKET
jgi:MFS family permease